MVPLRLSEVGILSVCAKNSLQRRSYGLSRKLARESLILNFRIGGAGV